MRARSESRAAVWAFTLATGLLAALPVIASTARALADRWMPAGDQAIIATRAYDVFSGHTPLVGQYSLVSNVVGHLTYSPGPMLYWLIALPSRFGSPHTIALTIGLANALAIVAIVAVARSRGGVPLMLASAIALALMCRSFMPEALHDNWNPSAGLLPFTLLVFLCWSLACGERRLLPAVALVGSFVAQCQVAFVAPTLALLAAGLLGLVLSRREAARREAARREAARREAARREAAFREAARRQAACRQAPRRRTWPWALAALAILVACWTPPVIDELRHSPGNLTLLYRAATGHSHTIGATAGIRAAIRAVGIPPRWLRLPEDPFDTRIADATTAPSALASVSAVALLLALVAVLIAGLWRRRTEVVWAAAIGLLLCVAFALVAASTPVSSVKVLGYTLWWGSVAGMWVWLTLAWSLPSLLFGGRPLLSAALRVDPRVVRGAGIAGCAALAAAVAAIVLGQPRDAHSAEYGPIASIASQLQRAKLPPRHATVWLRSSLGGVASPLSQAIKFLLRRRDLRILQRGAIARLGPWYELDHRPYDYVVYAYDRANPHDRQAKTLARVSMDESTPSFPGGATGHGTRVVTVSVAPASMTHVPVAHGSLAHGSLAHGSLTHGSSAHDPVASASALRRRSSR